MHYLLERPVIVEKLGDGIHAKGKTQQPWGADAAVHLHGLHVGQLVRVRYTLLCLLVDTGEHCSEGAKNKASPPHTDLIDGDQACV